MGILSESIVSTYQKQLEDGTKVYVRDLDKEWSVFGVSHGGYLLACLTDAVVQHQAITQQPDPVHLSVNYIGVSTPGPSEIHIKVVKSGREFTHLQANLLQKGQLRITTHVIAGVLPSYKDFFLLPENSPLPNVVPPHPLALSAPFEDFPLKFAQRWTSRHLHMVRDHGANQHLRGKASEEVGGFHDVAWWQLKNESESRRLPQPVLAFFTDMMASSAHILRTEGEQASVGDNLQGNFTTWPRTLTLAVEFRVKFETLPDDFDTRTFGIHTSGRMLQLGRHDQTGEIWVGPKELTETTSVAGVRPELLQKMFVVARSTKLDLSLPTAGQGAQKPSKKVAKTPKL